MMMRFRLMLRELVIEKNKVSNRARVLAGYCWEWIKAGQNDTNCHDIKIGDFEMNWNLGNGVSRLESVSFSG